MILRLSVISRIIKAEVIKAGVIKAEAEAAG